MIANDSEYFLFNEISMTSFVNVLLKSVKPPIRLPKVLSRYLQAKLP